MDKDEKTLLKAIFGLWALGALVYITVIIGVVLLLIHFL